MIRVMLIDDDPYVRDILSTELAAVPDVQMAGVFEHPLEAMGFLRQHPPDLLFLDIRMPGMNGFEMLDHLDTSQFEVIFITSYDQYAIQAIKYSALDYLLKPIQQQDLHLALERFRKATVKVLTRARVEALRHNLLQTDQKQFQLIIPTRQGEHHFAPMEIIRCEADSNYTLLYLTENRKFMASKTLSDIETMLQNAGFIRVHKSHLVNRVFVTGLGKGDELMLEGKVSVPISRRRLTEVKALFS